MNTNLNHKTALVCGGSKGLGYATAVELAKLGARVILLARTKALLEERTEALDKLNGKENLFLCVDMHNTDDLSQKVSTLLESMQIDILINNTGGPKGGLIVEAQTEQFLQAITMHLIANHSLAKLLIPGMKKRGYGRIINIVSTSVRQPIPGLGISNTIRGSIASWSKTLSNELASSGITVNNILPGTTKTERLSEIIKSQQSLHGLSEEQVHQKMLNEIPMGRYAEPGEIAVVVAFLASPAGSYITGTSIPVDGGKIKSI